jgi:hypothetical protein
MAIFKTLARKNSSVSGVKYIYSEVPAIIYDEMKKSRSKGIYFNQKIKNRYDFERIS